MLPLLLGPVAPAATLPVDDVGGLLSAIHTATDGDVIELASGVYELDATLSLNRPVRLVPQAGATVTLTGAANPLVRADARDVVLEGLRLDGDGATQLVRVASGSVTLRQLALEGGSATRGGAVEVEAGASAAVLDTTLTASGAQDGGLLASAGDTTIQRSVLTYGSAALHGGGVLADGGRLTVDDSTLAHNTAVGDGGALSCRGDARCAVVDSVLHDNSAQTGGAIAFDGPSPELRQSLLCFNVAWTDGGAVWARPAAGTSIVADRLLFASNSSFGDGAGGLHLIGGEGPLSIPFVGFVGNDTPALTVSARAHLAVVERSAFGPHSGYALQALDAQVISRNNLWWGTPLPPSPPLSLTGFNVLLNASLPPILTCSWPVPSPPSPLITPVGDVPLAVGPYQPGTGRFVDADGDGWVAVIDCDDTRAHVHPGAPEVPSDPETDENCDGTIEPPRPDPPPPDTGAPPEPEDTGDRFLPPPPRRPPGFACSGVAAAPIPWSAPWLLLLLRRRPTRAGARP